MALPGTADALLEWAHLQIGTTESPAGSNKVRYWADCGHPEMLRDTVPASARAWCATFVQAGLLAVGVKPVTRSFYVPTVEADYRRAHHWHPIEQALPGDQVCYAIGSGHTGIIVSIDVKSKVLTAIEGNTSPGTLGSQNNGGGVYQRQRHFSLAHGVGRPPFIITPPPVPVVITFPGEHMHTLEVPVTVPLGDGTGWWDLDGAAGRPLVPWNKCMGVAVNGGGIPVMPDIAERANFNGITRVWLGGFLPGSKPTLLVLVAD